MNTGGAVAKVVIDSPLPQLDHLFDYRIPESLASDAVQGARVRVPLRSAGRIASGYIVELADSSEFSGELLPLDDVISPVGVLTPQVWSVARAVADRAAGSASDILRLAIPGRQVRVERAWLARERKEPAPMAAPRVSGYPAELMDQVASGARLALDAIPQPVATGSGHWLGQFAVTLAQLAADTVSRGRSAIIVAPDFRDVEQMTTALSDLLEAERITRLDSAQSNADRYRGFLDCLDDTARVIVGNRSAVYAPARSLGMLAVWDDADPLHREPLAPYVHVRDAALVRQQLTGSALVLASHGRSSDTQRLVEIGYLREVSPERTVRPRIIVTARQGDQDAPQAAARIPSAAWRQASEALSHGPVLVQVARPGYAPGLACKGCGSPARCTVCNGPLGLTAAGRTPSCTWCGALAGDWRCQECEATSFRLVTRGSARTAEELGRAFPGVPVVIADGEHTVTHVQAKPVLVVATRGAEPIADGGYAAVLLLDGERMLSAESLRIAEDCLRWWSNAAALAAPRAPVMLVGVDGGIADAFARWDHAGFARDELVDRRTLRFPPMVRMASVSGASAAVDEALAAVRGREGVDILGPVAVDDGVRAIVRFDYSAGPFVAGELRAVVIRNATTRRRAPAGKGGYRPPPTLRLRFDDPDIQT
ncbi:primosomal protein N' [Okibacterium endophyticum]